MAKKKAAKKKVARKKAVARKPKAAEPVSSEALARAFSEVYTPPPSPKVQTVTLDPDIAPHFRSERAVNEALRALLRIVRQVRET